MNHESNKPPDETFGEILRTAWRLVGWSERKLAETSILEETIIRFCEGEATTDEERTIKLTMLHSPHVHDTVMRLRTALGIKEYEPRVIEFALARRPRTEQRLAADAPSVKAEDPEAPIIDLADGGVHVQITRDGADIIANVEESANHRAIAGAAVSLVRDGFIVATAVTDEAGEGSLGNLDSLEGCALTIELPQDE